MKEDNTIQEEKLIKKMFAKHRLETPSQDFTSRVVVAVEELHLQQKAVYKPLIGKKAWVLVLSCFVSIWIVAFFVVSKTTSQLISFDMLQQVSDTLFTYSFSELQFSNVLVYALCFLSLMICVQIPLLKNQFNKKYNY